MSTTLAVSANLKQSVPFFGVTYMRASLRFYVDGLGFQMKHWWIPDRVEDNPDGRIRWCWLERGNAAIMLEEFCPERRPTETLGTGGDCRQTETLPTH
jgi:lactoylglutathione lyase